MHFLRHEFLWIIMNARKPKGPLKIIQNKHYNLINYLFHPGTIPVYMIPVSTHNKKLNSFELKPYAHDKISSDTNIVIKVFSHTISSIATKKPIQILQVALQILGRKIYKNIKKSSLYSQSLLIFIHKTPVVGSHPITRENRDLIWPRSTPTGNTVYFYMSSSFIYTLKVHRRSFKHSAR